MTAPADNTPYAVINDAMHEAGLLQDLQYPTPEQYAKYMRRLRDLVNFMQTQGLKLWLNVDTPVTLVAGQNRYTFAPAGYVDMTKPLRVLQGYYYTTANGNRRPITVLSWSEWLTLSQVNQQGQVSQYFVDKEQSQLVVYFWITPDATAASLGTAHVLLQTQVGNPVELDETMNFPVEWKLALTWSLADEIAGGQPQATMERCKAQALYYRNALEDWDVEDASTVFQVDPRAGNYGLSRFR